MKRDLVMQVRELVERHVDTLEIARRLKLDPATVSAVIDFINNVLT